MILDTQTMNKDYIIEMIKMDCPICGKTHEVEKRQTIAQTIIKGEAIEHDEVYFLCPLSHGDEDTFVPAAVMDNNLLIARNAYRKKHGLLTSDEIITIRNKFGLTQGDFSLMFGWGEVTISRYETKAIQDETYDRIIRMANENPMFALSCLDQNKSKFALERYTQIRQNIVKMIEESGNIYLKIQEIRALYINYSEESDFNGFKVLDIDKLANVIGYFAQFIDNLYKVKLMKLLWYADVIYFKRYGKSITGLVYRHKPLGALPIAYEEILSLPTIRVEEEMICEDIAYKIVPNQNVNIANFSFEELQVLELVVTSFKTYKSSEIIEYMHKEKAYMNTMPNQIIPFSLAKQLNDFS